jgi:hypothetical protein
MRPATAALAIIAAVMPPLTSPTAPPTTGPGGTDVCVISDSRATELSGLVAISDGYVAINDSQFDASRIRIFYLDATCRVTKTVGYPTPARDPEDLAVAPDGTLWVSDTGDNLTSSSHRQTVALWQIPSSGAPVIHRLTYPDGPHDAEALFFTATGKPVIVTKDPDGRAGLYEPTGDLVPHTLTGVPLRHVGQFNPVAIGENNPLGPLGEILVTGAATSPDRHRVVLRTYTAAYEWDVTDDDPVAAIIGGIPRVTALPDEPQGESIAYTVDGFSFLTVSDESGPTTLRRYERSEATVATPPATPSVAPKANDNRPWIGQIPLGYSAAAALGGLTLVLAGLYGLRRGRRRRPEARSS